MNSTSYYENINFDFSINLFLENRQANSPKNQSLITEVIPIAAIVRSSNYQIPNVASSV